MGIFDDQVELKELKYRKQEVPSGFAVSFESGSKEPYGQQKRN